VSRSKIPPAFAGGLPKEATYNSLCCKSIVPLLFYKDQGWKYLKTTYEPFLASFSIISFSCNSSLSPFWLSSLIHSKLQCPKQPPNLSLPHIADEIQALLVASVAAALVTLPKKQKSLKP